MPTSDLRATGERATTWLERLRGIPPFDGASADLWARLAARARFDVRAEGEAIIAQGAPSDEVLVLLDGEVEIHREGRLVGVREGPCALDLGAAVLGLAHEATYLAASVVRVVFVPRGLLSPTSPGVAEALAREVRELRDARFRAALAAEDVMESPGALLIPGPYRFGPCHAHLLLARAEQPERLRALLPQGLRPLPGAEGRYLVIVAELEHARVAHHEGVRAFRYNEVTPFLPCVTSRGAIGAYIPELYPSATAAVLLGREMYGFPKRLARVETRIDGVDVLVGRERILRGRWSERRPVRDAYALGVLRRHLVPALGRVGIADAVLTRLGNLLPSGMLPGPLRRARVFTRKRILDERSSRTRRWAIDRVVEVPFEVELARGFEVLDRHDVRFAKAHPVLMGKVDTVLRFELAFSFGAGELRYELLGRGDAAGARAAEGA